MIGRTISHYLILERLGSGGMGVVYRARDETLGRDVVLKFLAPSLTSNEEAVQRLIQEARAASALDHPNICTIYGLEHTGDGEVFISMAYYQGEVLKDRLASGPMSVEQTVQIARQIAGGLAAAHAHGIIHRDIKPGNVILARGSVAKILDFGVAKLAGANPITRAGTALGTAAYMSPEQVRGLEVDHRTDIWSLGVVLYQMLTGALPFLGDRPYAVMHSVMTVEPAAMARVRRGIPEHLEKIVRRSLAKDPAARYPAMSDLLRDLKSFEPPSAAQAPPRSDLGPPTRRKNRRRLAAAVLGGAAVLGVGALLWRSVHPSGSGAPVSKVSDAARGASHTRVKRLAVIPFTNLRGHAPTDYLGLALADRITNRLGYYKGIVARPPGDAREYQNKSFDAAAAGKKLRADYILTGGFSSDDRTVRVKFELVDARSGSRLLQEPVEVRYEDAFRLQDIVAERVVRGLGLDQPRGEESPVPTDIPRNPLAYQYYLRSLSYPHGYNGNALAFPLLQKSIELDPGYAPAYAELGSRHELAAVYAFGGATTAMQAEQAFLKALSLNSRLLDALNGLARLYTDIGQSDKAIGLLRDALKINPSHADTHFALSYICRYTGMLEESAREGELALSLDPNNPRYRSLATTYLYLGNLDRSLAIHQLDPDSGWTLSRIGQIHLRRGQKEQALQSLKQAIAKEPESSSGRWASAMIAALQGRREAGLAVLRASKEATMVDGEQRYHFASVHCLLGDKGGCLRGLEAAVNGGFFNYPFLLRDSLIDPVRTDPPFPRILATAKSKHEAFKARFFPSAPQSGKKVTRSWSPGPAKTADREPVSALEIIAGTSASNARRLPPLRSPSAKCRRSALRRSWNSRRSSRPFHSNTPRRGC